MFLQTLLPVVGFVLPAMGSGIELLPRQTSPAERYDQALAHRAPAATAAPQPRWGAMGTDALFDRAITGSDTCGYISGAGTLGFYPLTCGAGYTCTNSGTYRGCCVGSAGCAASTNFFTACMDATACSAKTGTIGVNTLCCTYSSQYPYCLTYLWSTSALPGSAFTEYNCDASRFSGTYFLTADTPTVTSTSTSSSMVTTSTDTPTTSTSSQVSTSSSASVTPQPDPTPTPTPIGAIVGGVVGGVAVIALVGFLIWFLMRRKSKTDSPAQQPPQMVQPAGYPSPPPPGAPAYDPRYSYAATTGPISPTSGGYPSPAGSPAPFANTANSMGIYSHQSGDGWMNPQHTGASTYKESSPHSPVYGVHDASKGISEVDAVPVGKDREAVELA